MILPTFKPVINWRKEVNKSNLYSIYLRITLHGVHKYYLIPLPQKVALDQWTGKENAWIKNSHPYAFEINDAIREKTNILAELIRRYYMARKGLTFPIIFKELQKSNNLNSFNSYFDDFIKDPPETFDPETLKRYKACLKHLDKFNSTITFNDLSETLFLEFKKYCETNANLVGSTINGYFNALKKVVYWARKHDHITKAHQQSVFEDVHIKIGKPKKAHLEIEEIRQLESFVFPEKKKSFIRDRDMFLLLIYTGFYYDDIKGLLKTDLKKDPDYGNYLYSERYKNGNLSIVPLWKLPAALELIQKYASDNPSDPYLIKRDAFIEDQVFNRRLKDIAKMLKWTRNIYNKLGRTTNAQLYIRFGANRHVISKILGHQKDETTSSYFEVNIRDIIEGVKNVDFTQVGIGQKINSLDI